MKLHFLLILSFCSLSIATLGQRFTLDTSSLSTLNRERIITNKRGMFVLGSWATANIATGAAGYFIAKDDEWKAFHGMNTAWNVVNGLIAIGGYMGAKKEASTSLTCPEMLHRYESNKRLYLINGGLDLLYIGTGAFLLEHSKQESNPDVWKGFGESIALQGAFLLVFDGIMYASHQSTDRKWYKLLQGICVTGNGLGYRHTFN